MVHHISLAVRIYQFTCISTNTHIPIQENGNVVLAYRRHAAVDARCIMAHFLNMRQNRKMCLVRLQGIVFMGVR